MPLEVTMGETSDSYLHEPDEWIAGQIVDIQTTPDTGFGPGFKWVIALDDQKEGDYDQWAFCSQKLSKKSKLYGWLVGLGATVEVGQKYDLKELVDRRCEVMFERIERDEAPAEKVVKIRAEKTNTDLQKKQAETKAAKAPKRETTDFADDEAPF